MNEEPEDAQANRRTYAIYAWIAGRCGFPALVSLAAYLQELGAPNHEEAAALAWLDGREGPQVTATLRTYLESIEA